MEPLRGGHGLAESRPGLDDVHGRNAAQHCGGAVPVLTFDPLLERFHQLPKLEREQTCAALPALS